MSTTIGPTGSTPPPVAPATPAVESPAPAADTTNVNAIAPARPSAPGAAKKTRRTKKVAEPTLAGVLEAFPVTKLDKLAAKGPRGDTFMLDAGSLREHPRRS